ncbi:MAG: glycosyltransferase family 2 protein [Ardenticatenaceae bacterium]|nr:glycosyltransferase family 2 protein [Anaerolineales bacterium]MCB8917646.1 glycosyltransferase family 2 protein [Ardenticatenaceae bacterium]
MTTAVSIVIPAYNEEKGIGPVLTRLLAVMDGSGLTYEVVVVNDGSRDDTAGVTGRVAAEHERLTLLQHRHNRGYGAALKTGIRHARYDLICITDADGTYPNERIPELVAQLAGQEYDMVVGARTGENVAIPLVRRPAKWAIGRLANYVAGEKIPDLNSGLRVFRREIALRMFGLLPNAFSFTTTITLAMLTNNYLVNYVPIDYFARVGQSKIRPVQDTLNFVQLVWRIALYFAPLKLFLPLSGLLLLLAVGWALFTLLVLGQLADVSTLVIVMTAFQVAVIGMLAELINKRLPNYYKE